MSVKSATRNSLILAVNSGSSSLKISVFRLASPEKQDDANPVVPFISSSISSISTSPTFSSSVEGDTNVRPAKKEDAANIHDHATAFAHFLDYLKNEAHIDKKEIAHVCHRVVHGGDYLEPVVINEESYHHIERLSDLAPLHNGAALSVIQASLSNLDHANSIAYFDTAFHRDIPHHIASYAINQEVAKEKGLKKYGFHGLSYSFILRTVSRHLAKPASETNLIVLHLGSGASACAIRHGKSLDTSMGLTPVSGLPGATRAGIIDPTLIFHYTNRAAKISHDKSLATHVGVTEAEDILNMKSGWHALAGSSDFGEVVQRKDKDEGAKLAYDLFEDRILDFIGAYWLKLGGQVDALVFAGGIGEKSKELRESVTQRCACLGLAIDQTRNESVDEQDGDVVEIGKGGRTKLLVCRTDEQLEIARQCALESKFWK
ncbi:acetate and butyrate kinase [Gloeopeniophorella convolvens]|nr:acetate and butyrate kinase [Gloeopeniophorella convolvens]